MQFNFAYTHTPIDFYFRQSPRDFVVEEIPLYSFSGSGLHLILKIRKKNLTTFELLKILSNHLGVKERDIGYAGLKDKNALTIQHISLPISYKDKLESLSCEQIKILEITAHNNKLKIGHLKGNKFFIRLKKLTPFNAQKVRQILNLIQEYGIPNYFSYQRFGIDGKNYLQGQAIIAKQCKVRDKKLQNFLISAYQSFLFNQWLSMRLMLSHLIKITPLHLLYKALQSCGFTFPIPSIFQNHSYCQALKEQTHFFKLLRGDLLCHYPYGRNFTLMDALPIESQRFLQKNIVPTGVLSGQKVIFSSEEAGAFEVPFMDSRILSVGMRRYAWIFPENIYFVYKEEEAQGELSFFLPKGAYATNLLRELAHREIIEN